MLRTCLFNCESLATINLTDKPFKLRRVQAPKVRSPLQETASVPCALQTHDPRESEEGSDGQAGEVDPQVPGWHPMENRGHDEGDRRIGQERNDASRRLGDPLAQPQKKTIHRALDDLSGARHSLPTGSNLTSKIRALNTFLRRSWRVRRNSIDLPM